MEERRPRERELVLAPNEYAYVLDTTKGHINCYVGPNKTSLAQTDQPVVFNATTKRFEPVEIARATQVFTIAPANWYVELKNPARDNAHPSPGLSNAAVALTVGEKINIPGPVSFPLWPGQMARVIRGHRLRSNQYLYVQIYDPAAAKKSWAAPGEPPAFVAGEKRVIRGTDVSFYMPPTGVQVMPDDHGEFVRDAVTLERLQYCVLIREDGRKRYIRGEAVVFPEPNETFFSRDNRTAFQAFELDDVTGLYVKVIAPYVDAGGVAHVEGEELFLTGKNQIYFPREEHAIIEQEGRSIHQAIAVPKGSGRYVLDRLTGKVTLVRGPTMYLPDPRREVMARRVLTPREKRLLATEEPAAPMEATAEKESSKKSDGGVIQRAPFREPRTVTLGEAHGAVRVDVRSGYGVCVVDRGGKRRVVIGPASELLEYDETLESLRLSTGVPKKSDDRLETAHLRISGNEVSDRVRVTSSDLVNASVLLKYRVTFEGSDPQKWFAVEDYVGLLCDHGRSKLQGVLRQTPIRMMRERVTDLVRDALLGARREEARPGLQFAENGMRVYDVEVLGLEILDESVEELLTDAQMSAIRSAIAVAEKEASLRDRQRIEEIERALSKESHDTEVLRMKLEADRIRQAGELSKLNRQRELEEAELDLAVKARRIESDQAVHRSEVSKKADYLDLTLKELDARVGGAVEQAKAFSPHLITAIDRLADEKLLGSLASNFGHLAAIEGKGLLETARKFLDFMPSTMTPVLRKNGSEAAPAAEPERR